MSANTASTLEILIQIKEELAGLKKTQTGLKEAKRDADGLGHALKLGLGIGSGMALVTSATALFKTTLQRTAGEAFNLAGQVKDVSQALGITASAYQVLRLEFKAAGAEMGQLSQAISNQTRSLAEARDATSAAAVAYRTLGLNAAEIERLPIEERLIAVARATNNAADKTSAFAAASQILGSRGLPQMLAALERLGTQGVQELRKVYEEQGKLLSDDSIERLDRAKKAWEELWHSIVTHSAEAMVSIGRVWESLQNAPWDTIKALNSAIMSGSLGGRQMLAAQLDRTAPLRTLSKGGAAVDPNAAAAAAAAQAASDAQEKRVKRAIEMQDAALARSRDRTAAMQREGEEIRQSVLTPLESYGETVARLDQLNRAGAISAETFSRARARLQNSRRREPRGRRRVIAAHDSPSFG